MKKILFVLLLSGFAYTFLPQDYLRIANFEKNNFSKKVNLSKVNYPGDSTIDIKYYKINISLLSAQNGISGSVLSKMLFKLPAASFFFDLSSALTVDSVLVETLKVSFTHIKDILSISLPHLFAAGDSLSVQIFYKGVPAYSGMGSFTSTFYNSQPFVYTLSEPYGAKDWWPCKDTPADKADSADIWITVPQNLTAVSNGSFISKTDNLNGTATFKWRESYPIATYLIAISASEYNRHDQVFNYKGYSMPVTNYLLDEDLPYLSAIDKTTEMLKIFSDSYGLYPFIKEKYGHVRFGWGGGMEHQTIASMGYFGEEIIAHELSHQWFGDKVTCRDWHNIWLNEGFATFSAALYFQQQYGNSAYDTYINAQMNYALNANGSLYIKDISNVNDIFDYNRSYAKGSVVVHMLRGILGDTLFFRTLNSYLNDSTIAYGSAVTEDLQRAASNVSGKDLSYFFNEWVYGENFPMYDFLWNYETKNDSIFVNLNLSQIANSVPEFFTMPVQFKIYYRNNEQILNFFNNQKEQVFTFLANEIPLSIEFDPNNFILKKLFNTENKPPQNFELLQNYPNPFNGSTTISFKITAERKIKLKLYDVLGNEIKTISEAVFPAGLHNLNLSGNGLASGIYIYRLTSDGVDLSRKLILLK